MKNLKNKKINYDMWLKNQRVTIQTSDDGVLVHADQENSTPGVVTNIEVESGKRYVIDLTVKANCSVTAFLLDKNGKKRLAKIDPKVINYGHVRLDFMARESKIQKIGILFPSVNKMNGIPTSRRWFKIQSCNVSVHDARSGIFASMATMPSRLDQLPATIASLRHQVDHIFIHLNEFEEVPSILKSSNITTTRSQDFGNIRDTGKYLGLQEMSDNAIVFTVDDDIYYPSNYVEHLTKAMDHFENKAIVGVHGVIYPRRPRSFFDRLTVHYKKLLPVHLPVSCLGTGTAAFSVGMLRPVLSDFSAHGMADLFFAGLAKSAKIPLIAVQRDPDWLKDVNTSPISTKQETLYNETRRDHTQHTAILSEHGPWGSSEIIGSIVEQWGDIGSSPLQKSAKDYLRFLQWMERGCPNPRPEILLSAEIAEISATLKLPALLRESFCL